MKTAEGCTGFTFRVYNEDHSVSKREAIDSLTIVDSNMFLADYKNLKIGSDFWYAEIDGYLIADENGEYEFGVSVYGTAKLFVDNRLVVDNETNQVQGTTFFGSGSIEEKGTISVKKGQKYHIRVDFGSGATSKLRLPTAMTKRAKTNPTAMRKRPKSTVIAPSLFPVPRLRLSPMLLSHLVVAAPSALTMRNPPRPSVARFRNFSSNPLH